jgi:hypothetical protein
MVFALVGCKTLEPAMQTQVIAPDLSVFRTDVYELFPLIAEPQTDADLMYNNLITEMDATLTNQYADAVERYNKLLREILNPP